MPVPIDMGTVPTMPNVAPSSNPNFGINAQSAQSRARAPYMWPRHVDDWRWSKGYEATYCFEEVGLPPQIRFVQMAASSPLRRRARRGLHGLATLAVVAVVLGLTQAQSFVPAPGTSRGSSQTAAGIAAASLVMPSEAWAKGGQWGPLEGKASSLVHPIIMASLFFVTLYAGFLGWQWRQTREMGVELSGLRKKLPKEAPEEDSPAVAALKEQISKLDAERKEMVQAGYKDKHYTVSSILLGGGVFFTTYGVFNTWFRAEKLFPGPHLFAGAAIVVLWALAAALVPYMEKGNDGARNAHIALNGINVLLFAWQLPTGFEIAQKVWGLAIPWV
ncbi:unnamed protein product [Symbiodinium microadriaticum]|nr:unnamed protein product [Symbiodinium microadriaticum]